MGTGTSFSPSSWTLSLPVPSHYFYVVFYIHMLVFLEAKRRSLECSQQLIPVWKTEGHWIEKYSNMFLFFNWLRKSVESVESFCCAVHFRSCCRRLRVECWLVVVTGVFLERMNTADVMLCRETIGWIPVSFIFIYLISATHCTCIAHTDMFWRR
jgi:hypothetical protein